MKVLMTIYHRKNLNLKQKSKILSTVLLLRSQNEKGLAIEFSWKVLWEDAISMVMREKKYEALAGDDVRGNFIYTLVRNIV